MDEEDFDFIPSTFPRKFELKATHDGMVKASLTLGRDLVPSQANVRWKAGGTWGRADRINLKPYAAGVANPIHDRNHVSALAAINAMFAKGNEEKLAGATAGLINSLLRTQPNVARLVVRLIQLYWLAVFHEKHGVDLAPKGAAALPIPIESIAAFRSSLQGAVGGMNWLVVDLAEGVDDAPSLMAVLTAVCSQIQFHSPLYGQGLPAILANLCPLGKDLSVGYTGVDRLTESVFSFSSGAVWDAVALLSSQYGLAELFTTANRWVVSRLFSPDPARDPIFGSHNTTVHLPALDTRQFALFPIALAVDAVVAVAPPPEPVLKPLLGELIVRNQAASAAYSELLWSLGVGAERDSEREQRQAHRALALFHRSQSGRPSAIWGALADVAAKSGLPLEFSPLTLSMVPDAAALSEAGLAHSLATATQWEELVDVSSSVPSAALDSLLHPKASKTIVPAGRWHVVSTIHPENEPSTAAALAEVGAELMLAERKRGAINWDFKPMDYRTNYRGAVHDRPFPRIYSTDWVTRSLIARLPDASASLRLHQLGLERKSWRWWLIGTERPPDQEPIGSSFIEPPPPLHEPVPLGGDAQLPKRAAALAPAPAPDPPEPAAPAAPAGSDGDAAEAELALRPTGLPRAHVRNFAAPSAWKVWNEQIQANCADGAVRQLSRALIRVAEEAGSENGHAWKDYWDPIISPHVATLKEISLARAIAPAPLGERLRTARSLASVLAALAERAQLPNQSQALGRLVVKARTLAAAMAQCPALNAEELARWAEAERPDQHAPPQLRAFADDWGEQAAMAGIALSNVLRKKGHWEYRTANRADERRLKAERWMRNSAAVVEEGKIGLKRWVPEEPDEDTSAMLEHVLERSAQLEQDAEAFAELLDEEKEQLADAPGPSSDPMAGSGGPGRVITQDSLHSEELAAGMAEDAVMDRAVELADAADLSWEEAIDRAEEEMRPSTAGQQPDFQSAGLTPTSTSASPTASPPGTSATAAVPAPAGPPAAAAVTPAGAEQPLPQPSIPAGGPPSVPADLPDMDTIGSMQLE